ncbi:MAG: DUF3455 domain-containing protein [Deltaproteobacteria bacterium]|nr:MAG: DUF3455 domain-containing protein [Deltaproteobacteria bacterium]
MTLFRIAIPLLAVSCASVSQPQAAAVPENLRVPPGQTMLLRMVARGAQVYTCQARTGAPAVYEWVLKAPDADLFDVRGEKIGRHFAGPTWESADGSRVVGEVMERSAAPGAVPLLLLRAKSTEGAGALANVKYVQRLDTAGGVAPPVGCDREHAGNEARVLYSANYDFYGE